jgi:hypothetical protein
MSLYTLEAGRSILRDGKPFISIHRYQGHSPFVSPSDVDDVTRLIVALLNRTEVPHDFAVRPLVTVEEKKSAKDLVTCGTCGRSWDDAISTAYTPTPSARCPFEAWHK